jgi:hypothetical protein
VESIGEVYSLSGVFWGDITNDRYGLLAFSSQE